MKELSIEEKAKRYDEAKLRMSAAYNSNRCTLGFMNEIFPELKESEDEKIRKVLIGWINLEPSISFGDTFDDFSKEQILAWLEKQGEQKETLCDKCKKVQPSHSCQDITALGRCAVEHEQKSADKVEPKFKVGDKIIEKDLNECGCGTIIDIKDGKYIFDDGGFIYIEEQGLLKLVEQKPTDKVEPKFKVGDWIVYNDNLYHIGNIALQRYYECLRVDGTVHTFSLDIIDSKSHLWTIKDVKDGDVLFTSSTASHETFIFKSIDERGNAECYFAYDSEDGFREGKYHFIGSAINCKPATKEQRNTLMEEITDAGYTFDFEKKELRILKFRVGDEVKTENEESLTITRIDEKGYWSNDLFICSFEDSAKWELVGKLVDKVEPKFHEGEWVFIEEVKGYKNGPFQIKTVDSFGYSFDEYHTIPFMYEDLLSKWAIQDAKDGDVLVYEGEIFMIKSYVLWHKIVYHCCYDGKILHRHSIYDSWKREDFDKVHPATKEQCDLLFKKMKEAGYEWDS